MNDPAEHRVHASPATLADLRGLVDTLGTEKLTEHAISLDVRPPDDRPGWAIVVEYGPQLDERGLFWVDPDGE